MTIDRVQVVHVIDIVEAAAHTPPESTSEWNRQFVGASDRMTDEMAKESELQKFVRLGSQRVQHVALSLLAVHGDIVIRLL